MFRLLFDGTCNPPIDSFVGRPVVLKGGSRLLPVDAFLRLFFYRALIGSVLPPASRRLSSYYAFSRSRTCRGRRRQKKNVICRGSTPRIPVNQWNAGITY